MLRILKKWGSTSAGFLGNRGSGPGGLPENPRGTSKCITICKPSYCGLSSYLQVFFLLLDIKSLFEQFDVKVNPCIQCFKYFYYCLKSCVRQAVFQF